MRVLAAIAGCAFIFAAAAQAGAVSRLASRLGFSVERPAGWSQATRSDGAIEMLSPGRGAEGVVIARRQADILVSAVDLAPGRTLADAIAADVGDDRVVRRGAISATAAPGGCHALQAVDTLDEVGPGADEHLTLLYCQVGSRAWRVILRCWQADPAPLKRRWRDAAVAVARSLQVGPA